MSVVEGAAPAEKVKVHKGVREMHFKGVKKTISTDYANDREKGSKMWTVLKRNQKIVRKLDAAELHDLREGGDFSASAEGTIPYSEFSEQKIRGVARYKSEALTMDKVDKKQAEESFSKLHTKRWQLDSDCQGEQLTEMQSALSLCHSLALAAAPAARAGVRLAEYFQTSDNGTAGLVGSRFDKVAQECGSQSSDIQLYCQTDIANACSDGVIAYTLPSENQIAMCSLFWSYDAANPDAAGCHNQDRGTTILHEFTHADAVFEHPTADNGYGFDAIQGLTPQQNINNADTYAQYANGIAESC